MELVVVVGGAAVVGAAFVGLWPEPPQPAAVAARRGSTATSAAFVQRTRPVGSTRGAKSSCRAADSRGGRAAGTRGPGAELRRLGFFDYAVDALPSGRVEDASAAHPEGDVVGAVRRAVRHEIAGPDLRLEEPLGRLLLLVGIPWHETAAGAERHVHEARAIDAGRGHAAPLVASAEQRARVFDGVDGDRLQPFGIVIAAKVVASRPAGVRVCRLDAGPVVALLEDPERLAGEGLRDLLGVLGRLCAERREVACERMFA